MVPTETQPGVLTPSTGLSAARPNCCDVSNWPACTSAQLAHCLRPSACINIQYVPLAAWHQCKNHLHSFCRVVPIPLLTPSVVTVSGDQVDPWQSSLRISALVSLSPFIRLRKLTAIRPFDVYDDHIFSLVGDQGRSLVADLLMRGECTYPAGLMRGQRPKTKAF